MQVDSPPPDTPPNPATPSIPQQPTTSSSRKRKRPAAAASSPAPSEQTGNGNTTDLLATSRADLSSRPILTISRGPIFIPTAEGSEWFKTEMIGVNRVGYRYIPAGINPPGCASPCRTIESNPTSFRVSWEDRSPFLKTSKDGLSIAGSKGFRSARCNAPIREGKWYMEVKILQGGGDQVGDESKREGSHVRLGWGRREAPLNAPVGLDAYSYGLRDKTGDKLTLSRPRPYGRAFGTGDVIGMYISLPPRREPNKKDPHDPAHLKRERIPIDLKGQEVFEILEYPQSKEMAALMDYSGKTTSSASVPSTNKKTAKLPERGGPTAPGIKPNTPNLRPLPILPGSRIAFFINGECQGIAFQDLYDFLPLRQSETQRKANSKKRTREGVKEHRENPFDDGTLGYYPFISLFNDASVRLNPGPDFDFPPPVDIDAVLDGSAVSAPDAMTLEPSDAPISVSTTSLDLHSQPTENISIDIPMSGPTEVDIKPTIANPISDSVSAPAPSQAQQPTPTWRPAIQRYPEFMAEERAFDDLEEDEARVDLAKHNAALEAEEEKRQQREKKRKAAEARKRAKNAAKEQEKSAAEEMIVNEVSMEDEREREFKGYAPSPLGLYGPGMPGHIHLHTQPSPSPLRHSTSAQDQDQQQQHEQEQETPDPDQYHEDQGPESEAAQSPAPFESYGEFHGGQSGYTSENNQEDERDEHDSMDVDHDIEATLA